MTTTFWRPLFIWTTAWGLTGAALYVSGVFNSPRTGPLWVALAGGAVSWSIAGASTFSKQWNPINLIIWALAYLLSFALAGLSMTILPDGITELIIIFIGWSIGISCGAFASTWLVSDHSKLKRAARSAGIWFVAFFLGTGISFAVSSLTAELAKIFIGFLIGIPAALVLGFGFGCALGGFIGSGIALTISTSSMNQ